MTPPIDDLQTLRQILANTEALLLDFDGPICSVFAGFPAPMVAEQLREALAEGGYTDLPEDIRTTVDPFDVLHYAGKLGQDEARYVEAAFRAHEVDAVQSAQPTEHAIDLMQDWKATGRPIAVVSNNSVAAIETYLNIHDIQTAVDFVSARTNADVALLKPNPYLVIEAAKGLGVDARSCTLVGDSVTDIEAAVSAHAKIVAYANRPEKVTKFISSEPSAIVTRILLLTSAC